MKLCFSTLGCPDWDLDTIIKCCGDNGYEGIELRGLEGEMELPHSPLLATGERATFAARFADVGAAIAALGSSCRFAMPDRSERLEHIDNCRYWIELASHLNAGLVRVFGGKVPEGCSVHDGSAWVAESLMELADMAADHGTALGLETHDAFCTGEIVAEVLAQAEHPAVGVVWDVHHPYREGESVQDSVAALGQRIIHVHLKDSKLTNKDKAQYCLLSEGDVPVREALERLLDLGYERFLSLEWEKKWHPEIEEPEVAMPQYVEKMREYLAELKPA